MPISQPPASIPTVDLQALADLGQIVGGTAVLGGVLFAVVQLRQVQRQRRDAAAVDIIRGVQTQEIRQAAYVVLGLPDDTPPQQLRADRKVLAAAFAMDSACEMWGSMVYPRPTPRPGDRDPRSIPGSRRVRAGNGSEPPTADRTYMHPAMHGLLGI